MIGKVICLEPLFQDRINNHWLAYNFSIMFRWVIALISAYFILGLGVSAYGATPKTALQSQAAHSMVNAVAHDAAECADTLDAHTSTADSTFPSSPLQLVLDDLVVDLPDLLAPPRMFSPGDSLRVRPHVARLVPPHSPSLKRRPKPPKAPYTLA